MFCFPNAFNGVLTKVEINYGDVQATTHVGKRYIPASKLKLKNKASILASKQQTCVSDEQLCVRQE